MEKFLNKIYLFFFVCLSTYLICQGNLRKRLKNRQNSTCDSNPCQIRWGGCSATCGVGSRLARVIKREGRCGKCTIPRPKSCKLKECRVDCKWKQWSEFSKCSKSCGRGLQARRREPTLISGRGRPCQGSRVQIKVCNTYCCRDSCSWGEWGAFDDCSKSCGGGIKIRKRLLVFKSLCDQQTCKLNSSSIERSICNSHQCFPELIYSSWSQWSLCSSSCGEGLQIRNRSLIHENSSKDISERRVCNMVCCSVGCSWSFWSAWSGCFPSCDKRVEERNRKKSEVLCDSNKCVGDSKQIRKCNGSCCSDCTLRTWSKWSSCPKTCGSKIKRFRSRHMVQNMTCQISSCPDNLYQTELCPETCSNISTSICKCASNSTGSCCQKVIDLKGIPSFAIALIVIISLVIIIVSLFAVKFRSRRNHFWPDFIQSVNYSKSYHHRWSIGSDIEDLSNPQTEINFK